MWTWDGTPWTQKHPDHLPPGRFVSTMVYDSARQQIVLFGGQAFYGGVINDTWTWDGTDWTQQQPNVSPPARSTQTMTFDSVRQQVVMFGGATANGNGVLDDTWLWDGSNWSQATPATSPTARAFHSAAWDDANHVVVMFGGSTNVNDPYDTTLGDTWTWNGTTWTQQQPTTSPPSRTQASMVFDPTLQQTVMFDGFLAGFAPNDGTWLWDGSDWAQWSVNGTAPPAEACAGVAFDTSTDKMLLFGGNANNATNSDLWQWDSDNGATQLTSMAGETIGPMDRYYDVAAYDHARQTLVMYGGVNGINQFDNATWTWDGTAWTHQLVDQPPQRAYSGFADDELHQLVVMFGGSWGPALNDTWLWDGSSWSNANPVDAPPARSQPAMSYDVARQVVVLFSGSDSNGNSLADTWLWDGTDWAQVQPTHSPPPRVGATMAYDRDTGQTILFGGYGGDGTPTYLNDTWIWDGTDWTVQSPTTLPIGSISPAMVYDTVHHLMILMGGDGDDTHGTWVWNGDDWITTPQIPFGLRYGGVIFDEAVGSVEVIGSLSDQGLVNNGMRHMKIR